VSPFRSIEPTAKWPIPPASVLLSEADVFLGGSRDITVRPVHRSPWWHELRPHRRAIRMPIAAGQARAWLRDVPSSSRRQPTSALAPESRQVLLAPKTRRAV